MPITGVTASKFAKEAQLPGLSKDMVPAAAPVTFDPTRDQAWVVGPQIISFVGGVTAERREMIAMSALFASLAADATQQPTGSDAWYSAYANALTHLGWVLQEATRRSFDQEHSGSKVHQAVIEFIVSLGVGGTALTIIAAALKAMQKVGDDKPWITLFDRQTQSEDISGFQIGLVEQQADAQFSVKLMSFSLRLSQTNTQVLFVDFAKFGVHMDSIGNTVTVAEDVLKEALPTLKNRLQDYLKSYVSEVKLPPLH